MMHSEASREWRKEMAHVREKGKGKRQKAKGKRQKIGGGMAMKSQAKVSLILLGLLPTLTSGEFGGNRKSTESDFDTQKKEECRYSNRTSWPALFSRAYLDMNTCRKAHRRQ